MTEMLERVTKAIFDEMDLMDGLDVPSAERYAKAALKAMREPTPEVLKGMWRRNDDNDAKKATLTNWQDAIDAALGVKCFP